MLGSNNKPSAGAVSYKPPLLLKKWRFRFLDLTYRLYFVIQGKRFFYKNLFFEVYFEGLIRRQF